MSNASFLTFDSFPNVKAKKLKKINIMNSWVVRQFKNEYNPTHWHGGHIAGAGFLKVPKDLGLHVQKKRNKEYRESINNI